MSANGHHILVVEDTPTSMKLSRLVLENAGFTVDGAETGATALNAARDRHYDAIVLDLKLSGIDGLAVARQLRARPVTQYTPIVAVTACAMPEDGERALAAGCNGYLTKPIDVSRFAEEIRHHIVSAHNSTRGPGPGTTVNRGDTSRR